MLQLGYLKDADVLAQGRERMFLGWPIPSKNRYSANQSNRQSKFKSLGQCSNVTIFANSVHKLPSCCFSFCIEERKEGYPATDQCREEKSKRRRKKNMADRVQRMLENQRKLEEKRKEKEEAERAAEDAKRKEKLAAAAASRPIVQDRGEKPAEFGNNVKFRST